MSGTNPAAGRLIKEGAIRINELITVAKNEPLRPVRAGIWSRVIVDEPSLGLDEIFFEEGVETAAHGHDLAQAAYQVAGRFEIRLAGEVVVLGPGDGYAIPARAEHRVRCLEKGSYILVTARGGATDGHDHGQPDHDHQAHGDHAHDDHAH